MALVSAADAGNSSDIGTIDELNHDIQNLKQGDVLEIDKDYQFAYPGMYDAGIPITADNITINGNGHVIDGGKVYAIFYVLSDNVKIFNLTIINSKDTITSPYTSDVIFYGNSPITWIGANGVISDCRFYSNTAITGGAITWSGNNGIIKNCLFANNTASGVGGAVYVAGSDNLIINSTFINSLSLLTKEAIYYSPVSRNHNIKSSSFDGLESIEGFIDGYYFHRSPQVELAGEYIDVIPYLYTSIYYNQSISYKNIICCFLQNGTEFTLTLTKTFENEENWCVLEPDYLSCRCNILFIKTFKFSNVGSVDYIIGDLYNGCYVNEYVLDAVYQIDGKYSYGEAKKKRASVLDKYLQYTKDGSLNKILTIAMTVPEGQAVNANGQWDISSLGFDTVFVDGGGVTVQGSCDESAEDVWITLRDNVVFYGSNFVVKGFNNALVNKGYATLTNVKFDRNKINYLIDADYGAAVLNCGVAVFNNCTFTNNYAKLGGAIYNVGLVVLNNCTFSGNTGYGQGDNVCMAEGSRAIVDGVNITHDTNIIHFYESKAWDYVIVIATAVAIVAAAFIVGFAAISIAAVLVPTLSMGALLAIAGIAEVACLAIFIAAVITVCNSHQTTEVKVIDETY